MDTRAHTRQKLLEFVYEVQEGRVPNQMLLEYAADALLRSLKQKKPDVIPPLPRGRRAGEQRNLDRELQVVWLLKIRALTQEKVCERLGINETRIISRSVNHFEEATLSEVREYNKILREYRFKRKVGVIPAGEYYKVMCVFGGIHIVDAAGEREATKFIFDELNRPHAIAIAAMNKEDSK